MKKLYLLFSISFLFATTQATITSPSKITEEELGHIIDIFDQEFLPEPEQENTNNNEHDDQKLMELYEVLTAVDMLLVEVLNAKETCQHDNDYTKCLLCIDAMKLLEPCKSLLVAGCELLDEIEPEKKAPYLSLIGKYANYVKAETDNIGSMLHELAERIKGEELPSPKDEDDTTDC